MVFSICICDNIHFVVTQLIALRTNAKLFVMSLGRAMGVVFGLGLACQAKDQCCHTKKSTLAKIFTEKNELKCEVSPATTLQKKTR